MTVPSVLAVIEITRSYFLTHASESKLTNPDEIQEAIRGIKVGKASGPNGITNSALSNLPQRTVSSLPRFSTRFSAPITFHYCGSTLE
jgi:hypothetical protein